MQRKSENPASGQRTGFAWGAKFGDFLRLLHYYLEGRRFEWLITIAMLWLAVAMFVSPQILRASAFQWITLVISPWFTASFLFATDRNEGWLKIKAVQREKFPVVGFVKDPSGVAALYLGKKEGKDLVYMGKVGTGLDRTSSGKIRKALETVVGPKAKLTKPIKKSKATWVEPKFYAEVEYRDITSEGLLRASSFKGLSKGTGRS